MFRTTTIAVAFISVLTFTSIAQATSIHHVTEIEESIDLDLLTVSPEWFGDSEDGKPDYEKLFEAMKGLNDCYESVGGGKYDCRDNLKIEGQWKKPDAKMVQFLTRSRHSIRQIANLYGITAHALVGAALAEASLNSRSRGNRFVSWLQNHGVSDETILDLGQVAGRNISMGLAAMNERGACEALPVRQAVEPGFAVGLRCPGRGQLPAELRAQLGNAGQSLRYAAALIRLAQDAYFAVGCDASENMGALVTLYNMGRVSERAKRSPCKKGAPLGWNYLGLWAEKQGDTIRQILGDDYQPEIIRTPAIIPAPAAATKRP